MVLAVVVVVVVVVGVPSPCASVRDEGRGVPLRVDIARWGAELGSRERPSPDHSTVSETGGEVRAPLCFRAHSRRHARGNDRPCRRRLKVDVEGRPEAQG